MDTKDRAVRRLIGGGGAKLFFLPRYSPDLNPIEQDPAAQNRSSRHRGDLARGIGTLLDQFTPDNARQYRIRFGLKDRAPKHASGPTRRHREIRPGYRVDRCEFVRGERVQGIFATRTELFIRCQSTGPF
jgi:hypothetical protein